MQRACGAVCHEDPPGSSRLQDGTVVMRQGRCRRCAPCRHDHDGTKTRTRGPAACRYRHGPAARRQAVRCQAAAGLRTGAAVLGTVSLRRQPARAGGPSLLSGGARRTIPPMPPCAIAAVAARPELCPAAPAGCAVPCSAHHLPDCLQGGGGACLQDLMVCARCGADAGDTPARPRARLRGSQNLRPGLRVLRYHRQNMWRGPGLRRRLRPGQGLRGGFLLQDTKELTCARSPFWPRPWP